MEAIQMNNNVKIPKENEEVTVHLTVKELLSLSGDKFNQDHSTLIAARKKIRQQIEQHQQ
jgi:chromosomal replication initiation ATPase DnaA